MNTIDFNHILDRESCSIKIQKALADFQSNKSDKLQKRGIYVFGMPGSGKTMFVETLLEKLGYDIVRYDAGDIRNKAIIEDIAQNNTSDRNVLSMFRSKTSPKPIAIIMDEIDGMNNGDKGGINALIKLIRPKKTRKQKLEESTHSPIICISNNHADKKIKELMKVCVTVEIKTPTDIQIRKLIAINMPDLDSNIVSSITTYLHGDLRKFNSMVSIYNDRKESIDINIINQVFKSKSLNEDTKQITKRLINTNVHIDNHLITINEPDRTIIGLLWHENIVDCLEKMPVNQACPFYQKALKNMCYADYIDRITFQNQIWQFNEMSSLIKTFHTNKLYHETFPKQQRYNPTEVRFTKVLTKYSTEYNNTIFIQNICQLLGMDKKDSFSFLTVLRNKYSDEEVYNMLYEHDICKLDVDRLYRYLDKCFKLPCENIVDDDIVETHDE
jgi:SpoVK/Ycf46/Vps4 family AAA+-type ATPase